MQINPDHLIPMDLLTTQSRLKIDLVYADARHPENIFKTAVYHPDSMLWLHQDMAKIVYKTAKMLIQSHGWILVLKDGLRPVEAQEAMMQTAIVKANPQWYEGENRLLSPPGGGAHPRGMAIDVSVEDKDGKPIDMGTPFDGMSEKSARAYQGFDSNILRDRQILEQVFCAAAKAFSRPLLPLPSEWWDFRFPAHVYQSYAPLCDADLPPWARMTQKPAPIDDFIRKRIEQVIQTL